MYLTLKILIGLLL